MTQVGHGQIWWAKLDKIRPVLVLTRSTVAPLLTRVVIAPITTVVRDIPVDVALGETEGVAESSVANFDNVQLIPVSALIHPAGTLSPDRWNECCIAMSFMMACA
ncbi:MAG: type II toxin-antitoxin system PemK/MazF family toxin [Acidimicrobiia bacterium]|nr:type II toxin-antitoxin system PemK/MazF family toxin [Acidimicrobiia bacterium]